MVQAFWRQHYGFRLGVLAVICILATELGLRFATASGAASLIWPPAGIALSALLLGGWRYAPGIFAGLYIGALLNDASQWRALIGAVPTTVAWLAVTQWMRKQVGVTGVRNLLTGLAAACFGAALSATLGVGAFVLLGYFSGAQMFKAWLGWWAGDVQGAMYFGTLLLAWAARPMLDRDLARLARPAMAAAFVLLAGAFLSTRVGGGPLQYLLWYVLFSLALWPAVQLRLREVATFNVLIASIAIAGVVHGFSPFPTEPGQELVVVHGFLTFLALTTLILAAVSAERRRAVKQARASEDRFRSLSDLSADWVWEQDENLRYTYLSPGYRAATGRNPLDVIGKLSWELPVSNMTADDWEAHCGALKRREPFHGLLGEYAAENGEPRHIETSGVPYFDAAGVFRGYRGVGRNITVQKRAEQSLRESKRRLEDIIQASPQPISISGVDNGYLYEVNQAWLLLMGYERSEVLGRTTTTDLNIWVDVEDRDAIRTELLTHGMVAGAETRFYRKDGDVLDVLFAASSLDLGGEPVMLCQIVDITEMKRAERLLRQSEERFATIFRSSPAAIVISRFEDGVHVDVNDAWERLFGWSRDEIIGTNLGLLDIWVDPSEREHVIQLLAAGTSVRDREAQFYLRSGEKADVLLSAEVIDFGGEHYILSSIVDITERKRSARRIEELATRDALTGLPNRLLLGDRLQQGLVNAKRQGELLAIMFIDLDRFKQINDSLGHDVGDMLLGEVAARIEATLRRGDTLARIGGDEFVVVLEGLKHAEDAGQVAQKIISSMSDNFSIGGSMLNSTASVGISVFPDDGTDAPTLMRNADTAMYFAKESGRNCYRFFAPEMNARAVDRLNLEMSIRRAFEQGQFVVYFQPKFTTDTGVLSGAEALLRWNHPVRGLLSPETFIQVLEETGLIVPLGRWVIEEVCAQIGRWKGRSAISVAVNVSARQFADSLPDVIREALVRHQVRPALLEIEMTETTLIRGVEESAAVLRQVRELGVAVMIDDFGMGYSSLNYLRRFQISAVKIDQSFVAELPTSADDQAIVRAVVEMGHSLRLRVIAEGVETAEQLATLRSMGCDEYQGYYGGRPVPATEFETCFLVPRTGN